MEAPQFHASYDPFPEPLFLQTTDGQWLANSAADALAFSQTDFDRLAAWDGNASLWLGGRFYYVHGHRTPDGLFLLLHADAFLSSAALNLSAQLRQRLSSAFTGVDSLNRHIAADPSAAKEDISFITRSLYQIFRMVTELDHCVENTLSCNKVYLDLSAWLLRLYDEVRQWCSGHPNVSLHLDAPGVPLPAMADPVLLDYMVAHLLSNAIKAASDPGSPSPCDITLSIKKQGDQATLLLRSTGDSFSPAFLTDPLWNQPTRLLVNRGLGLGLPIAQRIAALHDGTLMVSPSKEGSQVLFSLPLATAPANQLSSPTPSRLEPTGGFSMVRVVLSDALPASAFHPDFHPEI